MYCLHYSQTLPLSLEACWDFFSSPANLKTLTPEHLGFEIFTPQSTEKMYAGQIIGYTICPIWNIPISWITEITHVQEPFYFIDEQRFGPYKFWHHEHRFNRVSNGVEMIDTVYYKMPFGFIGKALHRLKVRKELEAIFTYRRKKMEGLFGLSSPTRK